ncbi:MAG TPA: class I SAM-dependent methyltransferase [Thermomicrobiales bacterium]|nr:class I SAM-dependent methyltransferase [Thermomicrobiales bacterium]
MDRHAGATFDEVADLYHAVRPRYPSELFDRIRALPGLAPGSRLLELGMGTGIATGVLLDAGFDVTGIEPGASLAAVAREHLGHHPRFRAIVTRFEDWESTGEPFDIVFSATAFHWLDRRTRVRRAAACLREGGYLAIAMYHHVRGGDSALFDAVQACYGAHMPGETGDVQLLPAEDIEPETRELVEHDLFEALEVFRWTSEERYNRAGYFDLLSTYSGHRLLTEEAREALFHCIGEHIDRLPGGVVRKAYLHELVVARKT